ncbi:MAG: TolC family protein, partial [Bacteroidota bacterium]
MNRKQFYSVFMCLVLCSAASFAQEVWDLQKCIDYAYTNSITLQQADLAIDNAALTKKQNQFSRLPNLNGFTSFGFNFGRSIDPTTNQFESQNIRSNNFNLSTRMPIYSGGQITNSIKQSNYDMQAAEADKAASQNTVALNVASAYLNVLFMQDQLNISQNRLKQTKDQLAQTNKLIQAGSLPDANRIDLEAQQASDEQGLIVAENNVLLAYLQLKQVMNMDPGTPMEIERPNIIAPEVNLVESYTLEGLYSEALSTQPNIQANELRERSS